jgi:peptide/nickel transport system substrate-binding protein
MREGRRRTGGPLIAALLVGALVLTACSGDDADDDAARRPTRAGLSGCASAPLDCNGGDRADGGTLTWAISTAPETYNLLRLEGADSGTAAALAGIAPSIGDFQPDGTWRWNRDLLASEPKVTATSPQTMVYELRPEAVWSDGQPIDVDDFRYEWFHQSGRPDQCTACNPKYTVGWEDVAQVDGSDDGRTITITLKDGVIDAEWFALFEPSPNPAHVATAKGFDWRTPAGMQASSEYCRDTVPTWSGGPYAIDRVVPGARVVMVPNPAWYGAVAPTLDTLVKEVVPATDLATAIQNHEVDGGIVAFNPDLYEQIRQLDGVTTSLGASDTWDHVDADTLSPALQDLALRQAVFTAIDAKDARDRIYGDARPALRTNHFFPSSSPHHEDLLAATGFGSGDITAARAILTAAGYTGAQEGQRLSRDGAEVPALRLAFPAGSGSRSTFVELAQSYLAELGIQITPQPVAGPDFLSTLDAGDYDLAVWGLSSGPLFVTAPSQFFASDSPTNFSHVDDPEVDAAVAEVLQHRDIDDAATAANAADRLILADAVNLPLWDLPAFAFAADRVVGVRDDTFSYVRAMYEMQSWGLRAA